VSASSRAGVTLSDAREPCDFPPHPATASTAKTQTQTRTARLGAHRAGSSNEPHY
jgi:hypothetical protein